MNSRVIHFEIPVDDPERAVDFYRAAVGWNPRRWGEVPYWTVADSPPGAAEPGAAGGLTPRSEAPDGVLIYLTVDDIDATLERVLANGGSVVSTRQTVPGVGFTGRFRDTEGNVIGMLQEDAEAEA